MMLTALALRRPVAVAMFFVSSLVLGLVATQRLPLESLPDIDFPFLLVNVPYRNSTPEDVERRITRPVEEALATMPGIKRMRSESNEDGSEIFLELGWDENLAIKGVEARDKIDAVRAELPSDLQRVQVFKFSGSDEPMLVLRLSAARDLSNSYEMLERNLKRRIERLEGVSRVELYGPPEKELRIELAADRVAAHGVDLLALGRLLTAANFERTAGQLDDGGKRYYVRPQDRFEGLDDVGAMVINDRGLRLRDVADIDYAEPQLVEGRHLNRKFAVGLNVYRETGANLVEVSRRVNAEVERIRQLPDMQGISMVSFTDQAEDVTRSLSALISSGLTGAGLSLMVLYLFLRDWRATLIVTLAVPCALVMTLAAMYFAGYSLNILTLMGLMLSVGMLVDNSVVVTESVARMRENHGLGAQQAALAGVRHVGLAVTLGTLTTAIVFLPNLFGAQSDITVFLGQVAMTICTALAASLLVALTLIPLLISRVKLISDPRETWISRLSATYARWLEAALGRRLWMNLLVVGVVASVALPATQVKSDLFPQSSSRLIFIDYGINGVYSLGKVEEAVNTMEQWLDDHRDRFEIESIYSYYALDEAQSMIYLHQDEARRSKTSGEIIEDMRRDMPQLAIGEPRFEEDRSGGGEALAIRIYGESSEGLRKVANDVALVLRGVSGLTDVKVDQGPRSWEVQVRVDRERARKRGLSSQQVAEVVAAAMRGTELRPFRAADGETDVVLQFRRADRLDLDALRALPIISASGEQIALGQVAELDIGDVPSSITRHSRQTSLQIEFGTAPGVTPDDARKQVDKVLAGLQFPPGYGWGLGDAFDDDAESMKTMLINMVLALACIYLVMAALFESAIAPVSIMSCILFSFVGVWWFFWATGTSFSFMAMIGLLVLMGIVVNNGIVLVDYVQQLRAGGMERRQALVVASRDRLRPILMTAATTVLGMIPLGLSETTIGGNGPAYYPMARAVIGGLSFSTLVSLILLPVIYLNLDDVANWGRRCLARANGRLSMRVERTAAAPATTRSTETQDEQ